MMANFYKNNARAHVNDGVGGDSLINSICTRLILHKTTNSMVATSYTTNNITMLRCFEKGSLRSYGLLHSDNLLSTNYKLKFGRCKKVGQFGQTFSK